MKIDAIEMKSCIEVVANGGNADDMTIAEIAVSCNIIKNAKQ